MTYLGVTPGSVSALGLVHDRTQAVRVCIDQELKRTQKIAFHPNINTATLVISFADFERFLAAAGNPVHYVNL